MGAPCQIDLSHSGIYSERKWHLSEFSCDFALFIVVSTYHICEISDSKEP